MFEVAITLLRSESYQLRFCEADTVDLPENNQHDSRLCDVCGERPAVAQFRFVAGGERRDGAVCERCAREAMGVGATGGSEVEGGSAQTGVRRSQAARRSQASALDHFGH